MRDEQRRKLRHDILDSLYSIKLSTEVIRGAKDQDEALTFLNCIASEVVGIVRLVEGLAAEVQDAPLILPTNQVIPLTKAG